MFSAGEFTSCDRTIWTLAFHPEDSNILAVGSLGGFASVYKKFVIYLYKIFVICFLYY